jgi:hypothetical protein
MEQEQERRPSLFVVIGISFTSPTPDYLSSLFYLLTLYRRCGLAYPYNWRGFVVLKKMMIVGLFVFNPLGCTLLDWQGCPPGPTPPCQQVSQVLQHDPDETFIVFVLKILLYNLIL